VQDSRLRIAAIDFMNPAPLMWDFEHPPLSDELAKRYRIDRMTPAECAEKLATGQADIGLIPIAALATSPELRILPGCTIASKGRVRSLLLVHRAWQLLTDLQSVAAYKGLWQLITKPFYWEKTVHGISKYTHAELSHSDAQQ